MTNSHYSIFRNGIAQMWWTGSYEELCLFKKWVDQNIPKDDFSWFSKDWPKNTETRIFHNSGEDDNFAQTHLSGWFKIDSWTHIINWWAEGILGMRQANGSLLKWKLVERL